MTVANPLGNVIDNTTGQVSAVNLDRHSWIMPKSGAPWIATTVLAMVASCAK